jgi:preprotein translocase subunit SecD
MANARVVKPLLIAVGGLLLLLGLGAVIRPRRLLEALMARRAHVALTYDVDVAHAYDPKLSPDDVAARTEATMRHRLDSMGVTALSERHGNRVELLLVPTKEWPLDQVKRTVARTGQLEFKRVDDSSDFMRQLVKRVEQDPMAGVSISTDAWQERDGGAVHSDVFLTAHARAALESAVAELIKHGPVPDDHELLLGRRGDSDAAPWRTYYVQRASDVSGDDISDADLTWDAQAGRPEIRITFDKEGAARFEQATAAGIGRKLAIVVEGQVETAPVIESPIRGGHARITIGGFADPTQLQDEGKVLVAILRTGSLAAPLKFVSERRYGR